MKYKITYYYIYVFRFYNIKPLISIARPKAPHEHMIWKKLAAILKTRLQINIPSPSSRHFTRSEIQNQPLIDCSSLTDPAVFKIMKTNYPSLPYLHRAFLVFLTCQHILGHITKSLQSKHLQPDAAFYSSFSLPVTPAPRHKPPATESRLQEKAYLKLFLHILRHCLGTDSQNTSYVTRSQSEDWSQHSFSKGEE